MNVADYDKGLINRMDQNFFVLNNCHIKVLHNVNTLYLIYDRITVNSKQNKINKKPHQ